MFNRSRSLMAGLMAAVGLGAFAGVPSLPNTGRAYRGPTQSRRKASAHKNGMPSGYSGAKLARKAMQGKIGIRG